MSTYTDRNKRYYEKNKEKWKGYSKKYRSTKEGTLKAIYFGIRRRSELRGLEFDLELSDLLECPDVCPVLGIEIRYGETGNSHHSPSVDRFDPTRGYTKDNIRMISMRANHLKSDGTLKEFEALINYLKDL